MNHIRGFDLTVPEAYLLGDRIDVVVCRTCGVAFNDTKLTQADYDRYYAEASKYEDGLTTTGAGESEWDRRRLEDAARWIAARFPRTARIIDIGCATGGLLRCLRGEGFTDLAGIDPSERCAGIARESVGEAHVGSLFEMPCVVSGNLCILYAVLEHIRDVRAALAAARNVLDAGGCLHVVVPDACRYAEYAPSPYQDFNTEHINHFSHTTLDRAVCLSGFETIECGPLDIPTNAGISKAVSGLWRRSAGGSAHESHRDTVLEQALQRYVDASERRWVGIVEHLTREIDPGKTYLVWGTGQLLYKLLHERPLRNTRIGAFIDSNPVNQGMRLRGVPVLAPDAVIGRPEPIIVASVIAFESIRKQAREVLGVQNRLISLLPDVD